MKSPALYLLEVFFCSGMLLAFYRLLLVRKVSFAACRRYLVAAMLLSVAIPALDIPLYPARTEADPLPLVASQAVPPAEEPFVAEAGQPAAGVGAPPPATPPGRGASRPPLCAQRPLPRTGDAWHASPRPHCTC